MTTPSSQDSQVRSLSGRPIKIGKWNENLEASDVNQIWIELHRIVSSHPLVRASKRAGTPWSGGTRRAATRRLGLLPRASVLGCCWADAAAGAGLIAAAAHAEDGLAALGCAGMLAGHRR